MRTKHSTNDRRHHPACLCGKECAACEAERLSVSCGCESEAKQFEYGLDRSLSHEKHQQGKGGEASKLSHRDHEAAMTSPQMAKAMEADMRRRFWISFVLSIPIVVYSPLGTDVLRLSPPPLPIPTNWFLFLLATPIVFWAGSIFITGTYYSLKSRKLNMSVLIATGVLAAYLFSIPLMLAGGTETFYEAAALLVTFVLFGHWMEMRSRRGTSEALRALFDLVPPKATVLRNGKELTIPSAEVLVGDVIVIKPGDKIPVDGVVSEGETSIDESLITGESIPVLKKAGDSVIGGSVNQNGSVLFKASKIGSDTALGQIIRLVEHAQNSKAPGQRIADKAAAYLVILAISVGILTFVSWFFGAGAGIITALTFAVSAVVIACPDALGLATPTAVAVGTGIGARHNILIKDATTLEQTSKLQAIVLDKTGTLTEGKPVVTEVVAARGFDERVVIAVAGAAERKSNHPISAAILEEANRRGVAVPENISAFEAIGGHGVRASVDGKNVLAGTEKLMRDRGVALDALQSEIDRLLATGNTISILAVEGVVAGVIGVADKIKPSAKRAIAGMQALGLEVAMITGDHEQVAKAIADELGIKRYFAQVLPEEKASYVKKLQEEGKFVAMVGDGINDAPALAQSDIGIAIGAGTDVAIETANIVLMKSDPADILAAIKLSKATVGKMKQNLFWAAFYNILAIPVAAGVFYPAFGWSLRPEISALLMSASSIIVALNAVSLRRVESRLKT
ncbi:copper-translocating P-type ATPase [Candidatus Uhrbacteria bacterium]|nr:copper-translocating P-type ATPase [Candidatus Uhrbacteria bacterium]